MIILNPCKVIVTVYVPGLMFGNEYAPELLVVLTSDSPVASFFTVTVTPGTTPPSLSTTTPASELAELAP